MHADLHLRLREARRLHQQAECVLATLIFELETSRRYTERGHTSVVAYATAELDLTPRQTRDLLLVARHMRTLPRMAQAFTQGALSYTKAREIVRVATPETDAAWNERACATTSRELERDVAAARKGDLPPEATGPLLGPARVALRFDMSAAEAEAVRAALSRLRLRGGLGPEADDGALLADLARHALQTMESLDDRAAPTAERYRVTIRHCPDCQATHVGHPEEPHAAEHTDCACAECDAEVLDLTVAKPRLRHAVPPATRRKVFEQHGHRCAVPHCRNRLWLDLHHIRPRHAGGDHRAVNLVCLCSAHHRLIHQGGLHLIVEADTRRVRFALPTGEVVGERSADSPTGETLAARLGGALAARPGITGRTLVRTLGADPGHTAAALGALHAAGRAVVNSDDRWYPTDTMCNAAS